MVKLTRPPPGQTCCGVVEDTKHSARQRRNSRKPQPWPLLKFTIAIALCIIGFTSYVYVARFCLPMILKRRNAFGGRVMGIAYLAVFSVLLLMLLWTYVKVVVTSPGFAKDHVPHSDEPALPSQQPPGPWRFVGSEPTQIAGTPYDQMLPPAHAVLRERHEESEPHRGRVSRNASGGSMPGSTFPEKPASEGDAGAQDTPQPPVPVSMPPSRQSGQNGVSHDTISPQPYNWRMPPITPVLLPEHRFCYRDTLIKPPRAHHCQACGTCVLRFDHHCPWIGQCVGARNYKFFFNFVEWTAIFCAWLFGTMLPQLLRKVRDSEIDTREIAVIVLAGLFLIFTLAMLGTHIRLICLNQTTVESLTAHDMRERERVALGRLHSWYQFSQKKETKKRWDAEWGKIDTEGNLWWLGSSRANWESVMGKNVWWWFLPIGRSDSDGLDYPTNPRFDKEGRWMPRKDWPAHLR